MGDETEAAIDGSSSASFRTLVKEVITYNNYPGDPIVADYPELKSNRVENRPSVFRLPKSQYVLRKLEFSRLNLQTMSERKTSGKVFLKPPSTLERVAEVGDALHYVEKNKSKSLRVVREIPPPPVNFNDTVDTRRQLSNYLSIGVEFNANEAKQLEQSHVWGLKSLNYLDHFQDYHQSVNNKLQSQATGLQAWVDSDNPVLNEDVKSTIANLQAALVTSQSCLVESKDLITICGGHLDL